MAEQVGVAVRALPRARAMYGDRVVACVLRAGAVSSGVLFAVSVAFAAFPRFQAASIAADAARKAATALLLATPILRLATAGFLLGVRGEWRYAVYAGCVLLLLAIAVGAGYAA